MNTDLVGGVKAAAMLSVSRDTFYRLVAAGEIKAIEVDGGHPVYRRSDVAALASKRADVLRKRAAALDPQPRKAAA